MYFSSQCNFYYAKEHQLLGDFVLRSQNGALPLDLTVPPYVLHAESKNFLKLNYVYSHLNVKGQEICSYQI